MPTNRKWKGPKFRVPPARQPDTNTIITRPAAEPAAESWWLGAGSRDEFKRRHTGELPRMQGSKFGQRQMLITPPSGGAE